MSFKPANSNAPRSSGEDSSKFPTPRAGSRKARISLIVDLGTQNREDFEDPITKEIKPQKPCQQVVVFADLVADVVDYGGHIGKAPYRLMLNKSFMNEVQGINFAATPPKDAKGNLIQGKAWGLHPANLLSKIAKAVNKPEVIESMDISELLDQPFMAQVEVKETEGKKKDADGNAVIYKNVNYKGAAEVPEDDDGSPLPVAELALKARCITFADAKVEDIKFIRAGLLAKIKLALNYAGSKMQKAIEAHEAANGSGGDDNNEDEPAPQRPAAVAKKPVAPKKPVKVQEDEYDDDIPF